MIRSEVLKRLSQVMEESSVDAIDWSAVGDTTTIESFGFDSLAVLDLIFDLEQEFGVQIEASEMLKMKTVGDLINYLEQSVA